MRKMQQNRRRTCVPQAVLAAAAASALTAMLASQASAQFLSVDINGGNPQPGGPNLGWDGTVNQPVGGVVWQGWGGAPTTGGSGDTLPAGGNNGIVPPITNLSKSFATPGVGSGTLTVTLQAVNLSPSTLDSLNSRDRGVLAGGGFSDLYRDFIFVSKDFVRGNGANPMIINLSGLSANTTYNWTGYDMDGAGGQNGQQVYSVANPSVYDYQNDPAGANALTTGVFGSQTDPMFTATMAQRITFANPQIAVTGAQDQFSTTFKFTTDSNGNAIFYEWSNVSTQGAAILNGFQIGTVASSTRTATTSGTWGAGPWTNGVPDADAAVANFGSVATAQTVTIEGSGRTVGVLNVASPTAYTFAGGTLTMSETFGPEKNAGAGVVDATPSTGHAQINVIGGATTSVTHVVSSPVFLGQNTTINTESPNATLRITGNVSGANFTSGTLSTGSTSTSAGLNKIGPGTVVLTGNNTYGGTTNVFEGKLIVNGTHTGAGSYNVGGQPIASVDGGGNLIFTGTKTAILGGTGTITSRSDLQPVGTAAGVQPSRVMLWNGGAIAPGDNGVGVLTIDRVWLGNTGGHGTGTLGTGSMTGVGVGSVNLNIEVGPAAADKLVVTDNGGLLFPTPPDAGSGNVGTAIVSVSLLPGAAAGTYTILDYNGSVLDNTGTAIPDPTTRFFLANAILGGFSLSLVNNTANTSIDLVLTGGAVASATWNVDANGNWSTGSNWTGGSAPNGVDVTANFGTVATAARTVTVDTPKSVGTVNFSSANSYTIAGSSALTLDVGSGQANVNVTAGSHTISAPVVLNDNLTVTSAASTGVNFSGNVTATGKTVTKAGAGTAQFNNVRGAGLTVNAGGVKITANGTPNSPAGTSVVQSLNIATGATLDLTNNSAVIDYTGAVGTLVATTRQNLQAGRLTSSSADANRKLGYGDNAVLNQATFAGQTVDTSSILIKFTYGGDANLDGQVDVTDLGSLATNWQTSAPWTGGDFDYSGFVDVTDLGTLATNWQAGVGSPLGRQSFNDALAEVGLGGVSVPEPASIGVIVLAAWSLSRRRRGA